MIKDAMTEQELEKLVDSLTPWELEIVQSVLEDYPDIHVAKAIDMLRAFGL